MLVDTHHQRCRPRAKPSDYSKERVHSVPLTHYTGDSTQGMRTCPEGMCEAGRRRELGGNSMKGVGAVASTVGMRRGARRSADSTSELLQCVVNWCVCVAGCVQARGGDSRMILLFASYR